MAVRRNIYISDEVDNILKEQENASKYISSLVLNDKKEDKYLEETKTLLALIKQFLRNAETLDDVKKLLSLIDRD